MAHGIQISPGNTIKTLTNQTALECGIQCLKDTTCQCFSYNKSSETCAFKSKRCKRTSVDFTNILYNKIAENEVTCYPLNCGEIRVSHSSEPSSCKQYCKDNTNCDFYNYKDEACHLFNEDSCDITDPDKLNSPLEYRCIPNPIFSDEMKRTGPKLRKIIDTEDATCIKMNTSTSFNLRIPWPSLSPTLNLNNTAFKVNITGKNLKQCIRINEGIHGSGSGILAFVPFTEQVVPTFEGKFYGCDLIFGDDSTVCTYTCSFNDKILQAVHIKAFAVDEDDMEICSYKITN
ncbi:unnamed protein product [Dimorphilus gyrociliatus]|uniref:Apple domain-containing protein n=1 Tax=Dimorphilus gyrociliatus TaxID=2664684 RepID=A0A7I8VG75_9ANNE|nr:unnamed protein product [Dimorphilus gyrociliatus]